MQYCDGLLRRKSEATYDPVGGVFHARWATDSVVSLTGIYDVCGQQLRRHPGKVTQNLTTSVLEFLTTAIWAVTLDWRKRTTQRTATQKPPTTPWVAFFVWLLCPMASYKPQGFTTWAGNIYDVIKEKLPQPYDVSFGTSYDVNFDANNESCRASALTARGLHEFTASLVLSACRRCVRAAAMLPASSGALASCATISPPLKASSGVTSSAAGLRLGFAAKS